MGKPAVSLRNKLIALCAAGLIACGFMPLVFAFADDAQEEPVGAGFVPAQSEGSAEGATPNSILASALTSDGVSVISADVMLDDGASNPIIGSFTVDGMTFALNDNGGVTLVAVSPDVILSVGEAGVEGSLSIPSSITYAGTTYPVTAIGPCAFYLSGAIQVALPASITLVDDRAFRSSDVAWVDVDADNPNIASFDGALYSADLTSLLLIPEGRAGAVLLPCETEVAEPSKFSHCSLMEAIDVEEGGAAFASWDGLLYDASGQTLLRVPAGATEITIREGCTTIAAGAMEGCAKLERINAPASITSISPNVFESVPTISLPSNTVLNEADESRSRVAATIALSWAEEDLPRVNLSAIEVRLPQGTDAVCWEGFSVRTVDVAPLADIQNQSSSYATPQPCGVATIYPGGGSFSWFNNRADPAVALIPTAPSITVQTYTPNWALDDYSGARFAYYGSGNLPPYGIIVSKSGYTFVGWTGTCAGSPFTWYPGTAALNRAGVDLTATALWTPNRYTIAFDGNGGNGYAPSPISAIYDQNYSVTAPDLERKGYRLLGWSMEPNGNVAYGVTGPFQNVTAEANATVTLYAVWGYADYLVSFDVDSEPGDEVYPGDSKDDEAININDGQVEIEDPKRPGYVFQGWVIPNSDGTEAIDQDLVYQSDDGKWYVDASRLPDYSTDGKVELTARWTSVISVDVPSAVTFYADVVTQGNESREGTVSSAFGRSKVSNQGQVNLRVVGLESEAARTTDATLGADSILKKAAAATPATSASKLLSLYPSAKAWTAEELQDPGAVGGAKATTAVDFDLDDLLLEASFSAENFTIPAGGTLNMGYRLNLTETGRELDYDKLATLEDGQSAAIANVSYCFAAEYTVAPTGDINDPFWVRNEDFDVAAKGIYGLSDIKAAAIDLSANASNPSASIYYDLYKSFLDAGTVFHLKVNGAYQEMQILGICQDNKTVGGKAGLTFGFKDIYAYNGKTNQIAGGASFESRFAVSNVADGGWNAANFRNTLRTSFFTGLDARMQSEDTGIVRVVKFQQLPNNTTVAGLQRSNEETVFVPSVYEVIGKAKSDENPSEGLATTGYVPFQYQAYMVGGAANAIEHPKAFNGAASLYGTRSASTSYKYWALAIPVSPVSGWMVTHASANLQFGIVPCFCL